MMLANTPYLRYDRRHHLMWIIKNLKPIPSDALAMSGSFILTALITNGWDLDPDTGVVVILALVLFLLWPGFRVTCVLIEWRTRKIRLYSDGRLDYEFGIFYRQCQSISTRFGFIQYRYPDRFRMWLDCADLILPFDAGTITDIAEFQEFWNIAQGRV